MKAFGSAFFLKPVHIFHYSAVVFQAFASFFSFAFLVPKVGKLYFYPAVKESLFSHTIQKGVVIVINIVEDLAVGFEFYRGAGFVGVAYYLKLFGVMTSVEVLEMNMLSVANG